MLISLPVFTVDGSLFRSHSLQVLFTGDGIGAESGGMTKTEGCWSFCPGFNAIMDGVVADAAHVNTVSTKWPSSISQCPTKHSKGVFIDNDTRINQNSHRHSDSVFKIKRDQARRRTLSYSSPMSPSLSLLHASCTLIIMPTPQRTRSPPPLLPCPVSMACTIAHTNAVDNHSCMPPRSHDTVDSASPGLSPTECASSS